MIEFDKLRRGNMLVANTIVVGLLVVMLTSTSAQAMERETAVAAPTPAPKLSATILVANSNSVVAYAPGSNGNVAPIAAISDRTNMLEMPWGIALDSSANIYVSNYEGGPNHLGAITVYAAGSNGDTTPIATIGGPDTGLNNPFGIAVDSRGKIYVANFFGGVGSGSVTVYSAGSNGNARPVAMIIGADTALDNPSGIAIDSAGKIYVANRGGGRTNASSITVYAAGSSGNIRPIATIAGPDTGLDDPCIAVDSNGKIYAGNSNDSITVYLPGRHGNVKPTATIIGPDHGDETGLSQPNGIALDSKGNIYAANAMDSDWHSGSPGFNVTVYRAGSNGNVKPIATIGGSAKGTQAVAVDSSGKVYVATEFNEDSSNNAGGMITVLSPLGEGEVKTIATVYTTGKTGLRGVESIALDSKANIYVSMPSGGSSDLGTVAVFATGHYGNIPPTITLSGDDSRLHFPEGIAVDSRRTLHVANMGNGRTSGSVTVYAAGSNLEAPPIATITGDNTGLEDSRGIAVDQSGNSYVIDYAGDLLVYRHGSNGNVAPLATIDGDKPGIYHPTAIAVDSGAKIYVTTLNIQYVDTVGQNPYDMSYPGNDMRNLRYGRAHLKFHILTGSDSGGAAVLIYPSGSNGDPTPIAVITGPKTGLAGPRGIAVDSMGYIYVVNDGNLYGYRGSSTMPSVTVYPAGANGDVAPIVTISGPLTGLDNPKGIALGSPAAPPGE